MLLSTDDATCIAGSDSVYSLDGGRLRGDVQDEPAEVVPLRRARLELGAQRT